MFGRKQKYAHIAAITSLDLVEFVERTEVKDEEGSFDSPLVAVNSIGTAGDSLKETVR